jgi:PBP/GOBP family
MKTVTEQLEEIRQKRFPDEKNVKCYTNCLLEMMGSIKKGKILYEATLKQIDMLVPNDYKPAFKQGANACKDSAVGIKDNCEAAYTLLKCFVANNPKFVFP